MSAIADPDFHAADLLDLLHGRPLWKDIRVLAGM
jgi:hypothetical protein